MIFRWFWLFLSFGNGPIESTQKAWRVVNQKNVQLYPRRYKGINPIIIPDKRVRFEKGVKK